MTINSSTLPLLWAKCVEQLKDRVNGRSFWEALEQCRPLALEENTLVLGMDTMHYNLATHLQQPAHMHAIQAVIQEVFQQTLAIRVIEGAVPHDWEIVRARDQRVAASKATAGQQQQKQEVVLDGWDSLYEYIARLYAQTPNRSMPQGKARYLNDALYALAEAMDKIYPEDPDELAERGLARVL